MRFKQRFNIQRCRMRGCVPNIEQWCVLVMNVIIVYTIVNIWNVDDETLDVWYQPFHCFMIKGNSAAVIECIGTISQTSYWPQHLSLSISCFSETDRICIWQPQWEIAFYLRGTHYDTLLTVVAIRMMYMLCEWLSSRPCRHNTLFYETLPLGKVELYN